MVHNSHKINNTKIAFAISSYRVGGGERIMIDLTNEFARRGYNVDLLVLQSVGEYKHQLMPSVNVVAMDSRRMLFALPKLIRYLKRSRPEILLAVDEHTHIYGLIARYVSGVPTRVILRFGTMFSRLFATYPLIKKLRVILVTRFLYPRADGFIAVSNGVADDTSKTMRIPRERMAVVYNPKPLAHIEALAKEVTGHPWLEQKTLPVVTTAGRFRMPKNIQLLIRAFARARKDVPARLVLVGRGRDEDSLRALVRELHCEDAVAFAGYTDNPYAWMKRADLYVMSSLWEGMPNALIEAMACGVPIIATDCASGPREVLAPDTDYRALLTSGAEYAKYGVLTANDNEDALTEAMRNMLKDETMRAKYALLSKERARDFDTSVIVDEYAWAMRV